jgi:hypothetical protein
LTKEDVLYCRIGLHTVQYHTQYSKGRHTVQYHTQYGIILILIRVQPVAYAGTSGGSNEAKGWPC